MTTERPRRNCTQRPKGPLGSVRGLDPSFLSWSRSGQLTVECQSLLKGQAIVYDPQWFEIRQQNRTLIRRSTRNRQETAFPTGLLLSDSGIAAVALMRFCGSDLGKFWPLNFERDGKLRSNEKNHIGHSYFHSNNGRYHIFGLKVHEEPIYWTVGHKTAVGLLFNDGTSTGNLVKLCEQTVRILPTFVLRLDQRDKWWTETDITIQKVSWDDIKDFVLTEDEREDWQEEVGLLIRLEAGQSVPEPGSNAHSPHLVSPPRHPDSDSAEATGLETTNVDVRELPDDGVNATTPAISPRDKTHDPLAADRDPIVQPNRTETPVAETPVAPQQATNIGHEPEKRGELETRVSSLLRDFRLPKLIAAYQASRKSDLQSGANANASAPKTQDALHENLYRFLDDTELQGVCLAYVRSKEQSHPQRSDKDAAAHGAWFCLLEDPELWPFCQGYLRGRQSSALPVISERGQTGTDSQAHGQAMQNVFALLENPALWASMQDYRRSHHRDSSGTRSTSSSHAVASAPMVPSELDETLYGMLEQDQDSLELILGYRQSRLKRLRRA